MPDNKKEAALGYRLSDQSQCTRNVVVESLKTSLSENKSYKDLGFLLHSEIARWIKPQGPLSFGDIRVSELRDISTPKIDGHSFTRLNTLTEYLVKLCRDKGAEAQVRHCSREFLANISTVTDDGFSDKFDRAVTIRAILDWDIEYDEPSFRLAPPVIGRSTRLQRIFGWKRWLRVCVPEEVENMAKKEGDRDAKKDACAKKIKAFLSRPLRVGSCIYRPVLYKQGTLHFFLEEHLDGFDDIEPIYDFAGYIIPPELNHDMTIGKYAARFALLLSRTVPTIQFKPENIRRVPDVTSTTLRMGIGFMQQKIKKRLKLDYVPSCISGSFNGKRATWRVDYTAQQTDEDDQFWIEIYSDMIIETAAGERVYDITFEVGKRSYPLARKRRDSDVYWAKVLPGSWPGEGEIMTDGWGSMSKSAALQIIRHLGLNDMPAAFQGRIGGSKGLWSVSHLPESMTDEPWIEIHDSQHKFNFNAIDQNYTFDVVRWSTRGKPGRLSHQTIQILAAQGVPNEAFVALLQESIETQLSGLMSWSSADRSQLRSAVERCSGLAEARAKTSQISKMLNSIPSLRSFKAGEDDDADLRNNIAAAVDEEQWRSSNAHDYSCLPTSTAEQAIEMIDSGALPTDNPFLASSVQRIYEQQLRQAIGYRIPIPKSTDLFVIPDPTGTLKEGQVFIQFSQAFTDPKTGSNSNIVEGDVLVTRDPCVLPTDVQKVRAVANTHLRSFMDVIVFPSVGKVPLASLLGGGDYDGDTIRAIWQDELVESFENADHVEDTFDPAEWYDTKKESLSSYDKKVKRMAAKDPEKSRSLLAECLLGSLFIPTHFGQLANLLTQNMYLHGASHPRCQLLARLFALDLDASKQSKQLKAKALQKVQAYSGPMPEWTSKLPGDNKSVDDFPTNWAVHTRDKHLEESAMGRRDFIRDYKHLNGQDALFHAGTRIETQLKTAFWNQLKAGGDFGRDPDLTDPWIMLLQAMKTDPDLAHDAKLISCSVEACLVKYRESYRDFKKASDSCISNKRQQERIRAKSRKTLTEQLAVIQHEFVKFPNKKQYHTERFGLDQHDVRVLKASCLYFLASKNWGSFGINAAQWPISLPWTLAFRDLNNMKANAYEKRQLRKRPHADDKILEGHQARATVGDVALELYTRPPKRSKFE